MSVISKPQVSVIIPVYNGANYLREAIDSALAQTYENIEIIVVNDGSDDNGETENIANSYGDKIRYFHKENGGVATALNLGIAQMKGDYFSWLSHDDKYYPNKISNQVEMAIHAADKREIIFAGFDVIDSNGHKINSVLPLKRYSKEDLEKPLFALIHGMISGCSLLIHRSNFDYEGCFREDLLTTQDFELWFRMMRNIPCRVCKETLHMTRVHESQSGRRFHDTYIKENDELWIRVMDELSNEEKERIDGNVKTFYKNLYIMLYMYSDCIKAVDYAKQKALELDGQRIVPVITLELSKICVMARELINAGKNFGLRIMFKRMIKKFRGAVSM